MATDIVIVSAARTAVGSFNGAFGNTPAHELGATAIKAAAPVRTGKLRDSVKIRRTKRDLTLEVTAGGDSTTHGERGPHGEADYALFEEYGTRHSRAQPFFYPTARAMQADINANIAKAVSDVLDQ